MLHHHDPALSSAPSSHARMLCCAFLCSLLLLVVLCVSASAATHRWHDKVAVVVRRQNRRLPVQKTALLEQRTYKNDRFAKTGSGQTEETCWEKRGVGFSHPSIAITVPAFGMRSSGLKPPNQQPSNTLIDRLMDRPTERENGNEQTRNRCVTNAIACALADMTPHVAL